MSSINKQSTGGSLQKSGYQQQKSGCWDCWASKKVPMTQQKAGQQQKACQQQKAGCWDCWSKPKPKPKPTQQKGGMALLPPAKGLPPHLLRKRAHLMEMANKTKRSLANPAYGWVLRAPQRGKARHELMEKCGTACFLMPKTEGFPVCSSKSKCAVDCGGILSAYRRAKQYKYNQVADAAKSLAYKAGCSWI